MAGKEIVSPPLVSFANINKIRIPREAQNQSQNFVICTATCEPDSYPEMLVVGVVGSSMPNHDHPRGCFAVGIHLLHVISKPLRLD